MKYLNFRDFCQSRIDSSNINSNIITNFSTLAILNSCMHAQATIKMTTYTHPMLVVPHRKIINEDYCQVLFFLRTTFSSFEGLESMFIENLIWYFVWVYLLSFTASENNFYPVLLRHNKSIVEDWNSSSVPSFFPSIPHNIPQHYCSWMMMMMLMMIMSLVASIVKWWKWIRSEGVFFYGEMTHCYSFETFFF
jgi:hypothetical protein